MKNDKEKFIFKACNLYVGLKKGNIAFGSQKELNQRTQSKETRRPKLSVLKISKCLINNNDMKVN